MEVSIQKIVPNGLGMGFAPGLTIFVPLSAPGDRLRVEIADLKGRIAFARITEIIDRSEKRVEPPCEHFGTCGGCDFQHLSYEAQLDGKADMIKDCFSRIGGFEFEDIRIVASPETDGYRIRGQWHADTEKGEIGYFRRQSNDVVDTKKCLVLDGSLEAELSRLREEIAGNRLSGTHFEAAVGSKSEVSTYSEELIEPTRELSVEVDGAHISFNARTFFQGNKFLLETLVQEAVGGETGTKAVDLYAGVGLFALALAKTFESVTAVESYKLSTEFGVRNAERNGAANLEYVNKRVRDYLKEYEGGGVDLLVVDPPRAGLKKKVVGEILSVKPTRISYVSCNPSTLARDLSDLIKSGYSIESVAAVDLFPHTHHVETVVKLTSA